MCEMLLYLNLTWSLLSKRKWNLTVQTCDLVGWGWLSSGWLLLWRSCRRCERLSCGVTTGVTTGVTCNCWNSRMAHYIQSGVAFIYICENCLTLIILHSIKRQHKWIVIIKSERHLIRYDCQINTLVLHKPMMWEVEGHGLCSKRKWNLTVQTCDVVGWSWLSSGWLLLWHSCTRCERLSCGVMTGVTCNCWNSRTAHYSGIHIYMWKWFDVDNHLKDNMNE